MRSYDPTDWYWEHPDGRIYASGREQLVPADDEALAAWREGGGVPTPWPRDDAGARTEATLQEVLAPHGRYVDLPAARAGLKAAIDAEAERRRCILITPGAGQALEYQEAQRQAELALADDDPAPEDYPMLAASIGVDIDPQSGEPALDVVGVAPSVAAARAAWESAGAEIRRVRLTAKRDIDAAGSVAAARAVVDAIAWPELGG